MTLADFRVSQDMDLRLVVHRWKLTPWLAERKSTETESRKESERQKEAFEMLKGKTPFQRRHANDDEACVWACLNENFRKQTAIIP